MDTRRVRRYVVVRSIRYEAGQWIGGWSVHMRSCSGYAVNTMAWWVVDRSPDSGYHVGQCIRGWAVDTMVGMDTRVRSG